MSDNAPHPSPVTILIVDDDAGVRSLLSSALAGCAGRILEAADGLEALRVWEQHLPDLIVTDMRMPGLDGLVLIERILAKAPLTPIIMITGQGDVQTAVEAMKRGASDCLIKPIQLDSLVASVERSVEKKRLELELESYRKDLEQMVEQRTKQLQAATKRV